LKKNGVNHKPYEEDGNLERIILKSYFEPVGNSTRVSKMLEILKKFVARLYIERE
jgi:hypothetical protein